jgi:nitroreductase
VSLSPFQQLLENRQSVRRYAERPVSESDILSLVEAARQAPSAENAQPCRFVAVTDPAALEELARACFSGLFAATRFAARAPLIVALCAERATMVEAAKAVKDRAMYQLDCGIAGEHLVLRAAELGLGTCWIGWFNRRAARRALRAPFHVQVVCLIAVGYPAEGTQLRRRVRRPVSAMMWKDRWGQEFPGALPGDQNRK